jgi:hypothetical protein
MLMTGSALMDAERAFTRATRARRISAVARAVRRVPAACGRLTVYDDGATRPALRRGVHEIPLESISGTFEASRATLFDRCFLPFAGAAERWKRIWLAEHRGAPLPPISVVPVGDGYAVRDGHHRVSVARARGALTIDASIDVP